MGAGEDYRMNEPPRSEEFFKLFPKPRNWLFNPHTSKFNVFPLLGYLWSEGGKPEYNAIEDDNVIVNEFIKLSDEKEFRHDALKFKSIKHAVLLSKYLSFGKCDRDVGIEELRKGFELNDDEKSIWDIFEYTVCLNATYYKFMQDNDLKEKLLATGDKTLVNE